MLVYLHVPFCARRCTYCDFAIAVRRITPSPEYLQAILAEWRLRRDDPAWQGSPDVETVYFGGGTPSRLRPEDLRDIVEAIRSSRGLVAGAEVTIEANPDDVTAAQAAGWVAAGVNRVSLGVQSFHDDTLRWMHRTHSATQAVEAVELLRAAGLANISVDLIYGVPEDLGRDWMADLQTALGLEPVHLSLYALTVEPGTALGKWTVRGTVHPAPDQRVAEEYLEAHALLRTAGFEHYEVSNAARPGFRAVHNAGYWERRPFLGLGPSAHSGAGHLRRWNVRDWEAYRRVLAEDRDPVAGTEHLTDGQIRLEEVYLGLRTDRGVPEGRIPASEARRWCGEGWATIADGRVTLTAAGWLRLDALVARLPDGS